METTLPAVINSYFPHSHRNVTMSRSTPRRLRLESLESRELMAGNVSVSLVNQEVQVTGDAKGNGVLISEISPNVYKITGLVAAGSATTINGKSSITIRSPQDDLRVYMNGGNDVVAIGNATGLMTVEDLTVDMGDGADYLELANLEVYDRFDTVYLRMGREATTDGKDNLEMKNVTFRASVDITLGAGDDECEIRNTSVRDDLKVNGGSGKDEIELVSVTADEIYAWLGSGSDDRLELEKTRARRLVADGGSGIRDKYEWRSGNSFTSRSLVGFE